MAKHFVAMAGIHGCMPQFLCSAETVADAAEILADVHELGRDRRRALKRDRYLELNMRRDGNEYCEIVECDCDHPEEHDM